MPNITNKDLLDAGVHFGHLRKKWNPKMAPYIFMERKGIHIIDINKTMDNLEKAGNAMRSIAQAGKKILFVATKKQGKDLVKECAERANMPFVTERWLGGMLTNFSTIRKSIKKMQSIDKMISEDSITKKERLMLTREKEKMERILSGIANINRIPGAIYIVDITFEHIALAESKKLGLKTFGMVDTNSDPTTIDFPIPSNDDASKSIHLVTNYLTDCIIEGLEMRKKGKKAADAAEEQANDASANEKRQSRTRSRKKKAPEGAEKTATQTETTAKAEASAPTTDEAKKTKHSSYKNKRANRVSIEPKQCSKHSPQLTHLLRELF